MAETAPLRRCRFTLLRSLDRSERCRARFTRAGCPSGTRRQHLPDREGGPDLPSLSLVKSKTGGTRESAACDVVNCFGAHSRSCRSAFAAIAVVLRGPAESFRLVEASFHHPPDVVFRPAVGGADIDWRHHAAVGESPIDSCPRNTQAVLDPFDPQQLRKPLIEFFVHGGRPLTVPQSGRLQGVPPHLMADSNPPCP